MKRIILIILFLLIIASIVIYFYRVQIVTRYVPKFEQQGEIQVKIIDDTIYIKSKISIRNKLFFRIELDSVSYNVRIRDKSYIKNQKIINMELNAYEKDTFSFSLGIPHKTIIKELKTERKYSDSTDFSISLILHFKTPMGNLDIPFTKSTKLKLPQFPIFKIVDIEFKKIRSKEISAVVTIKANNSTKAELVVTDLNYQMQIYRAGNLKGKYISPILLKPNSVTYVSLPISIVPSNFGKTIFQLLMNKDKYYYKLHLNGIMKASGPIQDTFSINVVKNGQLELKKSKK